MKVTLCTSCMNRNDFLEESLKTWLKWDFDEIVIVDWSSATPVRPMVDKYQDGRIVLVEVQGEQFYNSTKARTTKTLCSRGDYIVSTDCDIRFLLNWRDFIDTSDPKEFHTGCFEEDQIVVEKWGKEKLYLRGTSFMYKSAFNDVNGYNERDFGRLYGYDETEFYHRLKDAGYKWTIFDMGSDFISHIHHPDDRRVEHFDNVDTRDDSINRTRQIFLKARRASEVIAPDIIPRAVLVHRPGEEPKQMTLKSPGKDLP